MEENRRLVMTTSQTLDNVIGFNNLGGEYCNFRGFFGAIIRSLENIKDDDGEPAGEDEYITQDMYIDAMTKLGLIKRGAARKAMDADGNKEEYPTLILGESDRIMPPKEIADAMLRDMYSEPRELEPANGIYKVKRGTFGFYCGDTQLLVSEVVTPVVNLLIEVNKGITNIYNITEEQEEMIKALDMSIVGYRDVKIKALLGRLLK